MPTLISSLADVEALLIKLIKEGNPGDFTCVVESKTIPEQDIEGFDSLTALEVLTEFEEETGIHVEGEIFYDGLKAKKHRSIEQTAVAIWNEIEKGTKKHA